ncbi:urease accessory protein UreE [Thalassovita taeanensis]|uniref:Urease accessory protein UreE n=1 Tax=Thalassovita taeanensis TaxID=657014 RepID=A0A1H9DQX3_9RHOB|nr:urease accessory protein UreE [Thalassovita taeanensis]SEQ15098.1 urease accessory protein [Thalassovita taeanensis]
MTDLGIATQIITATDPAPHSLSLTYEDRFLRRKRLTTVEGATVLLDLPRATSLEEGQQLATETGQRVDIFAAPEQLLAVSGPDLHRMAWHIGNRHTPCQIEADRLLIQRDHVIMAMLSHLGAVVTEVTEPFTPEGGAYGHGRTHSHEHGNTLHAHAHDHTHDHSHDH